MSMWEWNGARWWRFDFHAHTPASNDYGKGPQEALQRQRSPSDWLLDYMGAGIDCVAVTDHNTGAWIDALRRTVCTLEQDAPSGYRPIKVFPGVEISVSGGVHVLAILGPDSTTSDVDWLLGAVKLDGSKGSGEALTSVSLREAVSLIARAGGIPIPAHADLENGLFTLQGQTLRQALDCEDLFAVEIIDPSAPKPQLYLDKAPGWTEVLGSDSHHSRGTPGVRHPGSSFTWVKMGTPSLEGLRLALLDGPASIVRSDEAVGDPNDHSALVIESIEVSQARFMGRARPFVLRLNPWLNAVIGGRGTGKSTVVEFLRLVLRREDELPPDLKPEFEKYRTVYASREQGGLLTEDSAIRLIYRKNGSRFRIQWSPAGDLDPIQAEDDRGWRRAEGDVPQRFPVRLYSQKQIFHLATAPLALLKIVDQAPEVDRRSWNERWNQEESQFLSLRAKTREIEAGLAERERLRGELDDVIRRLNVFEKAGHAKVLKDFQLRNRQRRAVEQWELEWADAGERLRQIADELVPSPLDEPAFGRETDVDDSLYGRASTAIAKLTDIAESVRRLAREADDDLAWWRRAVADSLWKRSVESAERAYRDLRDRLAAEGLDDPAAYGELVQRRQTIEHRLNILQDREAQVELLHKQTGESLGRLLELRRDLTERRRRFLDRVLGDNRYVRIEVLPYGARETVESEFRRLLQRPDTAFEKDIGAPGGEGLLANLYAEGGDAETIERAVSHLKRTIRDITRGEYNLAALRDRRFAAHLGGLQPEALDRLDLWFPEDSLDVQYSTTADGQRFRSIHEASPGQKTAALLAFLLSYGDEPLVLDQPEDDLDNHLIYDLIVTQLREVKRRRQIIAVTHNPNIVVNGDAELIVAFAARGGETQLDSEGSLQDKPVRDTVCDIMEGGREAFRQRYRRIALEGHNV